MKLLIINPGSTSTKLALYDGAKKLLQENLEHDAAALQQYHGIGDQVPMRLAVIRDFLDRSGVHPEELAAVIGRGGLVFGLKTGGYLVNEDLCHALVDDDLSQPHASNLGGLLAREIAAPLGIPAYIYDAVTSGELTDVAKITGFVDIERRSFCHVLNSRAMALRYAREHGKHYEERNLIVAHLGGGISASVHRHGEIIDSVGDDDGQFSPERSGCVPSLGLIKLCYSGKYTYEEMRKKIRGRGGMYAHLGTSDCRVIEQMIRDGDRHADLIFQAQAYQIAKAIGLLSIVLKGDCDAIILTGGVANSKMLTERVEDYVRFIAPVCVMPGENEMEALALGALLERKSAEYGHPIYIIADEPYRELVYDNAEVPYIPGIYRDTVICYSYSKSLSMPGERIGYVCIPDSVTDSAKLHAAVAGASRAFGHVCAPSMMQRVIARATGLRPDLEAYDKNRHTLYNALSEMGYECVKPEGAFYMMVKAPGGDAHAFSERAKKENLLLVPADSFGCPGFFRISTCVDPAMIQRSLPAFRRILQD